MGKEREMVAAATLQRDTDVMLSNLQILSQFAMALNSMSFSMMALGLDRSLFPGAEVGASTGTTCATGGTIYVGHGVVAPSGESNCAETCSDTDM